MLHRRLVCQRMLAAESRAQEPLSVGMESIYRPVKTPGDLFEGRLGHRRILPPSPEGANPTPGNSRVTYSSA